jgi:DinB family protein
VIVVTEADALSEAFGRLPDLVRAAVRGLSPDELHWVPAPGGNSIGWLVWHLTRVQDHHVAELLDEPQLWTSGPWASDVGVEADPDNTGYGHRRTQVAQIRPTSAAVLIDYYDAVSARTLKVIKDLTAADLTKVVDERWDPPVTMRVRLVSVLGDDLQHVGQAAYVRGLLPAS